MNIVRSRTAVYKGGAIVCTITSYTDVYVGKELHLTQDAPSGATISDPAIDAPFEVKWVHAGTVTVERDGRQYVSMDIRITDGCGRAVITTHRQANIGTDEVSYAGVAPSDPVTGQIADSVALEIIFDPEDLPDHVYFGLVPEGWVGRTKDDLAELMSFDGDEPVRGAKELVIEMDGTVSITLRDVPHKVSTAKDAGFQADVCVIAWVR